MRKAAHAILRHARREFGLGGDDETALADYVRLSQRVVEMGERVAVQVHRDRLQYVFGAKALGAVAIVDWRAPGCAVCMGTAILWMLSSVPGSAATRATARRS